MTSTNKQQLSKKVVVEVGSLLGGRTPWSYQREFEAVGKLYSLGFTASVDVGEVLYVTTPEYGQEVKEVLERLGGLGEDYQANTEALSTAGFNVSDLEVVETNLGDLYEDRAEVVRTLVDGLTGANQELEGYFDQLAEEVNPGLKALGFEEVKKY